jgi:hypothetical protein
MTTTATPRTTTVTRTTLLDRVGPAALVLGAAGNLASAVATPLLGERPVGIAAQVAAVADRPLAFGVVMGVGALAVPALATGLVWAARLLRPRMPRTATAAAGLLVAGMWGLFAVHVLARRGGCGRSSPRARAWSPSRFRSCPTGSAPCSI